MAIPRFTPLRLRWGHGVAAVGLLCLSACSTDRDPSDFFAPGEIDIVVVDALLRVGQEFPSIYLSRTGEPDQAYDPLALALSDASVEVITPTDTIVYEESSARAGEYVPLTPPGRFVLPETTYRLRAETPRAEIVTATTTTPPDFTIRDWVQLDAETFEVRRAFASYADIGDSVYSVNRITYTDGILEARFDDIDVPAFQVALFSLDPDSDFVIDPEFFEEEDFEDLDREGQSPALLAEENFIRLPWFAIYFEGRYRFELFAIDRNWFDLVRSVPEFAGGGPGFGGEAGDGFERPLFHVEGGIGIFGSASVDSIGLTVLPR